MSLHETIAPTLERIAKGRVEAPAIERNVVRRAHRSISEAESLLRAGKLTREQFEALSKLERHYYGSLGVDVGDDDRRHGINEVDYAQTYHAQKVAEARRAMTPNEYAAQIMMIETGAKPEDIGRCLGQWKQRSMATGYGLSLLHTGTDRLIKLWGLQAHPG